MHMANGSPFYNLDNQEGHDDDSSSNSYIPDLVPFEELEDGSQVFDIEGAGSPEEFLEPEAPPAFDRNLCDELEDKVKDDLASDLLQKISDDLEARQGWEKAVKLGMKYLGVKVEESRDYPFMNACSAFDSTLSKALFRFWATARAELLPSEGPARSQIIGRKTPEAEDQGERLKAWMNYYLTKVDKDYYPDTIRMLLYVGLAGSAYKKVYQSPLTRRPISRFIDPQDFIPDPEASSIFSASRLSHRMYKTKKELMLLMLKGFYTDIDINKVSSDDQGEEDQVDVTVHENEGVSVASLDNKKKLKLYEIHVDVDLEGFEHTDEEGNPTGMPLPYIVTVLECENKVISVRRNWEQSDDTFERIQCFIKYDLLPGFGFYGIGYAQLLGSNAIALTAVLRQLIDAGCLKNFPGGLRVKGLRIQENDLNIGPSEFREIETGGLPIKDAIMTMPYNEPSVVLKDLREQLKADTEELAATSDLKIADMSGETPVGTTMAMLEVQTKVQSSVMRSLHMSLSDELELLYNLFAQGLEEDPGVLKIPGMSHFIKREDFTDDIRIVPVSDPNLTTNTQRMMHAEAILRLAQSNPELHNLRNAYFRMYQSMNVEDIEALLPLPENTLPLDPISENKNAMEGKPLKAAVWQDHNAHIAVHETFSLQNPDIEALKAHIHEHRAMQYGLEMENALGFQLPPLDQIQDPQIQNAIALQSAQVAMQQQQDIQSQNPEPLDPVLVMMEEVKQKDRAAQLKNEEAQERNRLEAMKAQLRFETDKRKAESDLDIAEERNETDQMKIEADLAIAQEKAEVDLEVAQLRAREAAQRANAKKQQGD